MFERYTEQARQVIFYARFFASDLGGPSLEPEHILLAILQEDRELFGAQLESPETYQALRSTIERHVRQTSHVPASADMPLSARAKRILTSAAAQAEREMDREIRPSDLLAGVLNEPDSAAAEAVRSLGPKTPQGRLFFVAASNGAAPPPDAGELHRLVDRLPRSQSGRAQALLEALLGAERSPEGT